MKKYEEIRIDTENKEIIKTKVSLQKHLGQSTSERKVLTEELNKSFGVTKKQIIEIMAAKYNVRTFLFNIERSKSAKEYELWFMLGGRKWEHITTKKTIAALLVFARQFKREE